MTTDNLPAALHVALLFAIFYFAAALLTGIWKWRSMLASHDGQAHAYVDIAHHAGLHYGPFILLAGLLASFWPFDHAISGWILIEVLGWTMVASLSRYICLGIAKTTTNQLTDPSRSSEVGLAFFAIGAGLPGLAICVGAAIALTDGLPGNPFG